MSAATINLEPIAQCVGARVERNSTASVLKSPLLKYVPHFCTKVNRHYVGVVSRGAFYSIFLPFDGEHTTGKALTSGANVLRQGF